MCGTGQNQQLGPLVPAKLSCPLSLAVAALMISPMYCFRNRFFPVLSHQLEAYLVEFQRVILNSHYNYLKVTTLKNCGMVTFRFFVALGLGNFRRFFLFQPSLSEDARGRHFDHPDGGLWRMRFSGEVDLCGCSYGYDKDIT